MSAGRQPAGRGPGRVATEILLVRCSYTYTDFQGVNDYCMYFALSKAVEIKLES